MSQREVLESLFEEIDQNGACSIDKLEFRFMLRALKITFSNERFRKLFREIDRDGDSKIVISDLHYLLFEKKVDLGESDSDDSDYSEDDW